MTDHNTLETKSHTLLHEQIRYEFAAGRQYIAIAVYFDNDDLPQLAKHFYKRAVDKRNHAMRIVQYFIDRDVRIEIPGTDEVRNQFDNPRDALALALDQERTLTKQVSALTSTARDEGDYLGEQFMWVVPQATDRRRGRGDHPAASRQARRRQPVRPRRIRRPRRRFAV